MRLLGLGVLLVACVAAVAYVASADGEGDGEDPSPARPAPREPEFEGRELGGTIYLLAGQDELNADLYRARGSLGRVERLTRGGRVSVVAAHGDVVVVSNARGSGSDRLERANLSGGDTLPGKLIDPYGQGPELSRSGKLLYSVVEYEADGAVAGGKVYETEPRPGAEKRVLLDSKRPLFAGWGPGERLAAFAPGGRVVTLDPGGPDERTIDPGLPRVTGFLTSATDAMMIGGPGRSFAVVPPDGPPRRLESDWQPLEWSPDGSRLLAVNGSNTRLGLMSPRDGSVEEVGRVSGGKVFQAQWVAEEG